MSNTPLPNSSEFLPNTLRVHFYPHIFRHPLKSKQIRHPNLLTHHHAPPYIDPTHLRTHLHDATITPHPNSFQNSHHNRPCPQHTNETPASIHHDCIYLLYPTFPNAPHAQPPRPFFYSPSHHVSGQINMYQTIYNPQQSYANTKFLRPQILHHTPPILPDTHPPPLHTDFVRYQHLLIIRHHPHHLNSTTPKNQFRIYFSWPHQIHQKPTLHAHPIFRVQHRLCINHQPRFGFFEFPKLIFLTAKYYPNTRICHPRFHPASKNHPYIADMHHDNFPVFFLLLQRFHQRQHPPPHHCLQQLRYWTRVVPPPAQSLFPRHRASTAPLLQPLAAYQHVRHCLLSGLPPNRQLAQHTKTMRYF